MYTAGQFYSLVFVGRAGNYPGFRKGVAGEEQVDVIVV